jgi:hypothetical protein
MPRWTSVRPLGRTAALASVRAIRSTSAASAGSASPRRVPTWARHGVARESAPGIDRLARLCQLEEGAGVHHFPMSHDLPTARRAAVGGGFGGLNVVCSLGLGTPAAPGISITSNDETAAARVTRLGTTPDRSRLGRPFRPGPFRLADLRPIKTLDLGGDRGGGRFRLARAGGVGGPAGPRRRDRCRESSTAQSRSSPWCWAQRRNPR